MENMYWESPWKKLNKEKANEHNILNKRLKQCSRNGCIQCQTMIVFQEYGLWINNDYHHIMNVLIENIVYLTLFKKNVCQKEISSIWVEWKMIPGTGTGVESKKV